MSNTAIVDKFERIVRCVQYNQIQVKSLNIPKIKSWAEANLKSEVNQLTNSGWNLDSDNTWQELVFSNSLIDWYGNAINLYVTSYYTDYLLASRVISSKLFKGFRSTLGIHNHVCLLLDPIILLEPDDLDTIYENLDAEKGFTILNLSHYNDQEALKSEYTDEWGWLESDSDTSLWTADQLSKVTGTEEW